MGNNLCLIEEKVHHFDLATKKYDKNLEKDYIFIGRGTKMNFQPIHSAIFSDVQT